MNITAHEVTNIRIVHKKCNEVVWLEFSMTSQDGEERITLFLANSLKDKSVAEILGLAAPVTEPEPQS